ncbi:menaquinone biosynthesis decarboxylase [Mollicutes bacterium LVI A0078]|nr:menaquinone biosynthesis decarboxylase [Mollicutes bacterium LVI A0075]WOO91163.1 menaquinone biosynthesis decarboxylase [Mollicutes bacterium LVI A0078]
MAYKDLQHFLKKLEAEDELIYIDELVSRDLEITEISDRVMKAREKNKAIIFRNVEECDYPLCINIFGSDKRMCMALEVDSLNDIGDGIRDFMELQNYKGIFNQVMALPKLARLYFSFPSKLSVGTPPCQQVIDEEVDLDRIPILKCWPQDGGRFFTMPLVFTKDPETGTQNVGMYRMQVFDKKTTGMHWHLHKDGKEIYEKYRKLGIKKMPVSVVVGSDPATIYSATAPLPKMIDETMLSSYLRKRPLQLVKSVTNDIYIPANSEFVFEGYVDIDEDYRLEGPFGDHTGYYSLADMYPVFHVEKITHKKNPIFDATIVGMPPMEDCYLSLATERIFLPLLSLTIPEIKEMHLPFEAVFHNGALLRAETAYPKHASKIVNAMWGMGQMMYQKLMVVYDQKIDLRDYKLAFETFIRNTDFSEDIMITEGPLDALDHSSINKYHGARVGFDSTLKSEDKLFGLDSSETIDIANKFKTIEIDNKVCAIAIQIEKHTPEEIKVIRETIIADSKLSQIKLVVVVDQYTDVDSYGYIAWRLFNNIDANRDFTVNGKQLIIDATRKLPIENGGREWPDDIIMDEEIVKMVTEKFGDKDVF